MDPEGFEYFIYEHFFGYTKINGHTTEEYQLHHPSWLTNTVTGYKIDCDFKAMYGHDFEILNSTPPSAVFLAEGSQVEVEWKRTKLKFNAGQ